MPARTRTAPPTTPTWRCGHPRTPTPTCRVCKRDRDRTRGQAKRLAAFRCGHPRTSENTVRRPDRADACRSCKSAADQRSYRKGQPKRRPYIDAMTPVQLAEARALYNKAMGLLEDSTDTAQGALGL